MDWIYLSKKTDSACISPRLSYRYPLLRIIHLKAVHPSARDRGLVRDRWARCIIKYQLSGFLARVSLSGTRMQLKEMSLT